MRDKITIVDYEAGNLASVRFALQKLGYEGVITGDPEDVRNAARVIFPGVGVAPHVMDRLNSSGMADALREHAAKGLPLLGICIGAQVILDHSDEGDVDCLGIIPGRVTRLEVPMHAKIPHMGWNEIHPVKSHPLLNGIEAGEQFYFVHSFAPTPAHESACLATTDYYGVFTSVLAQDNVVATQFHPERSGRIGLKLIENFLGWTP